MDGLGPRRGTEIVGHQRRVDVRNVTTQYIDITDIIDRETIVDVPETVIVKKEVPVPSVVNRVVDRPVDVIVPIEKIVKVPVINRVDNFIHKEVINDVYREVPQVVTQEVVTEVPRIVTQEVIKNVYVPQITYVDKVVPRIREVEKTVHVPGPIIYEDVYEEVHESFPEPGHLSHYNFPPSFVPPTSQMRPTITSFVPGPSGQSLVSRVSSFGGHFG